MSVISRSLNALRSALLPLILLGGCATSSDEATQARFNRDLEEKRRIEKESRERDRRILEERLRKEDERLREDKKRQDRAQAASRRKDATRGWRNEDVLRLFALKESPTIWQTIQQLRTKIIERGKSISQLRRDLKEFDIDPDNDPDYLRLCRDVEKMLDSLVGIFLNLEKAYIAAKKFEVTPSRKDYEATMRNSLENGIREAESATRRFKEMQDNK